MKDKNDFGGGNKNSLYIPMSEIEQEFIQRLVETQSFRLVIHDWGYVEEPRVTFGDKNLHVFFKLCFDRPENPMPVHYFDLELQTRSGVTLSKQRMNTEYGGQPILVKQGLDLDMVWDIAIKHIDPKLLKSLMPSVTGLTSRLQDRDNHEFTVFGNMRLNRDLKDKALKLNQAEKNLKSVEAQIRADARKNPRNMFEKVED
jgi:hypothetical protein